MGDCLKSVVMGRCSLLRTAPLPGLNRTQGEKVGEHASALSALHYDQLLQVSTSASPGLQPGIVGQINPFSPSAVFF